MYPNTPEGEKLITNLEKQITAFTIGHLGDHQTDRFINNFLTTFVEPQLVHKASQCECEWDSKTQTLLTPAELTENLASAGLEEQGWWKDVVEQYKSKWPDKPNKWNYASQQARHL